MIANLSRRIVIALLALLLTSASAYAGPFLDYSFAAVNPGENPEEFVFTFMLPYAAGPYDTLLHSFSSTVTDVDGTGTAAVVPSAAFMSVPFIDGSDVGGAGLGSGCLPIDAPGFVDLECDAFASTSVSVVTLGSGVFGTTVKFVLAGGDSVKGTGRLELIKATAPEPASVVLLGIGAAGLVAVRRRRRAN